MNNINYFALPGLKEKYRFPTINEHKAEIVIDAVCFHYNCNREQLLSTPGRVQYNVTRRQICSYLLRADCKMTFISIAKLFGKEHSSIVHYNTRMVGLIKVDPETRDAVAVIRNMYM